MTTTCNFFDLYTMRDLFIGATGLVTSVVTTPLLTSEPSEAILNAIVQVVIAVATLLGLIRKRKRN